MKKILNLKKGVCRNITFFSNRTKIVDSSDKKVEKFLPSNKLLFGFFVVFSFGSYYVAKTYFNFSRKRISVDEIKKEN